MVGRDRVALHGLLLALVFDGAGWGRERSQLFTGDRALYNLESKRLVTANFSGEFTPFIFSGDTFSITKFGRAWLEDASQRPIADPSRLSQALQGLAERFGGGYAQRATEAVRTYRTGNYLAACVMCAAAAESILLGLAVAKIGDEAKVLVEYNTTGGRRRITKRICVNVPGALAAQLETVLQPLGHRQDSAGHATMTTVSEIEAHIGLTDLLRLAQFVHDHWAELAARD